MRTYASVVVTAALLLLSFLGFCETSTAQNATFSFVGGELILDGFDIGQDLSIHQESATINGGTPEDTYLFNVANGSWAGGNGVPGNEFEIVAGELRIATDFFGLLASVSIDGQSGAGLNDNISLTQVNVSEGLEFASLDLSNITNSFQSLDLNIDGDLSLNSISANNNSIGIAATGDVRVGSVSARTDINLRSTGGSINDLQDDQLVNLTAGGEINLTAQDEVGGSVAAGMLTDPDGKLEVAASSVVDSTSSTGDIALRGLGDLTLDDIAATTGAVDIVAAGDVLVSLVTAGTTIDIMTSAGSVNDLEDDLAVDFNAGGLITLDATDEVGGNAAATVIDPDGKVEFANGSVVNLSSNTGAVALRGLGDLEIDAVTAGQSVNIMATGSINDNQNDAVVDIIAGMTTAADTTDDFITLMAGNDIAGNGADGKLEVAGGSVLVATSTTGGDIALQAGGSVVLQNVSTLDGSTAISEGNLLLEAIGDVTQTSDGTIAASGLALVVDGNTLLDNANNDVDVIAIDSQGPVHYTNTGDLRIDTVTAESVVANLAESDETSQLIAAQTTVTGLTIGADSRLVADRVIASTKVDLGDGVEGVILDIEGDFELEESAELLTDLLGTQAGEYDLLRIDGTASLDGHLTLRDDQANGQAIITATEGVSGVFSKINGVILDNEFGIAATYTGLTVDATKALLGDTNLDGKVDVLVDGFRLVRNLGTESGSKWSFGDFDGDGVTDIETDAQLLIENLGKTFMFSRRPSSSFVLSATAVPEPSAFVLLIVLLPAMTIGRRNRTTL